MLWHNSAGDAAVWEAHSISFLHNQLEPNATLHFDRKVHAQHMHSMRPTLLTLHCNISG